MLTVLLETGGDTDEHIQQLGLAQVSDEAALTQNTMKSSTPFQRKSMPIETVGPDSLAFRWAMHEGDGRSTDPRAKALLKDRLG